MVGKWHLGSKPAILLQQRGLDDFFGFLGGAHSYFSETGILRGTEQYLVKIESSENKDHPWFLYLSFNAVHTPMHATDDWLAKFPDIAD